ncbi:MAG: hypothetical protein MUF16_02860 [Burkholderiaceae bacterium]|nr:hypothetical protein [Burkholderiaceae bacterium]
MQSNLEVVRVDGLREVLLLDARRALPDEQAGQIADTGVATGANRARTERPYQSGWLSRPPSGASHHHSVDMFDRCRTPAHR